MDRWRCAHAPLPETPEKDEIMEQLTLVICMNDDPDNTLLSKVRYVEKNKKKAILERAGVALLSDNAILVARTIASGSLFQVCAILDDANWPFLLFQIQCQESLAFGKQDAEVERLLSAFHVPSVPLGGTEKDVPRAFS